MNSSSQILVIPKYVEPQILLMNMEEVDAESLKRAGYNISTGSFGTPYAVEKSDGYLPVMTNEEVPETFAEQDIVIVDVVADHVLDTMSGEKRVSPGENDLWASCSRGLIDPRPATMWLCREGFDRILTRGGVFIIFAGPRIDWQKLVLAHTEERFYIDGEPTNRTFLTFAQHQLDYQDNWCFLSALSAHWLTVNPYGGRNITAHPTSSGLGTLLRRHTQGASFVCTLQPTSRSDSNWVSLAQNKDGNTVALGVYESNGLILILPRVKERSRFLVSLIDDILPELAPSLFPYKEGVRWVERPEYEIPGILELKVRIDQIKKDAELRIEELTATVEQRRQESSYLHDLIRETGGTLVKAVKRTLESLGFQNVVDVDDEMSNQESNKPRREDLQVRGESTTLLIEIKGVAGLGTEGDKLEIIKYMNAYMRQHRDIEVHGLSLINHQRHKPALERENKSPFQEDVITTAQHHHFGLMTTWDLFRLVRSFQKNNWTHEQIRGLFYRRGRIDPVPSHYEYIGAIQGFIENLGVVGVRIEEGQLRVGDRIAFELLTEFEEQTITTLQVNKQAVESAASGMHVGLQTHITKAQAKDGVKVFRVMENRAS